MPAHPTWIEPPPPPPKRKAGCFPLGCLIVVVLAILLVLVLLSRGYFSITRAQPVALPVENLSPDALSEVQQRVEQFKSTPPAPSPEQAATQAPAATPVTGPSPPAQRELRLTASDINGLIAANPRARGHAFVSMSGNTATVQLSIPTDKVPELPKGYLNGKFTITTDGPTPLAGVQVSKAEANGIRVPSQVLSTTYRGRSVLSYALEQLMPYHVSTAEIRDGVLYAR